MFRADLFASDGFLSGNIYLEDYDEILLEAAKAIASGLDNKCIIYNVPKENPWVDDCPIIKLNRNSKLVKGLKNV